jgi:hypothetical protein
VARVIEETKQNEIESLYDVYLDEIDHQLMKEQAQ